MGRLLPKSGSILEAVLYRGELPRGDAGAVVGTGERQARRIVSALLEKGGLYRRVHARRCASLFRLRWHRGGCRGCFLTSLLSVG